MIFYKIYLVNNFETEKEISNRPLARGYEKVGANELLENYPSIIVFIDNDMLVHEFFTGSYLRKYNITGDSNDSAILAFNDLSQFYFELIPEQDIQKYNNLRKNLELRKVITKVIFNQNNDFELSTMEELAQDRAIQFEAFTNGLTTINPYSEEYMGNASLRYRR